ncbi:cobyric acid synthase [Marinospirillum perlucidum]|uniref:cobyric acid synthase n=1 Tax=Marinospirillum perlucidum TaxID=1982602 RepID=UPI001FE372D8|nr:cobyric acid synthase [Marinospirillum perlucidum]
MINRFRGDPALLQSGLDWLEAKTGKPVLGVLPYLQDLHLDAEDALPVIQQAATDIEQLKVVVPALPRISNHTDFDPLIQHPQVDLQFIRAGESLPAADLIILPGSKSVIADLKWLRSQGWEEAIHRHLRYGGRVLGICGGLQMLGQRLDDPESIEGPVESLAGLGLLDFVTRFEAKKQLRQVEGHITAWETAMAVKGYEIHSGRSQGPGLDNPLIVSSDGVPEGAVSEDGQILATYWHGFMDSPEVLDKILQWAGLETDEQLDIAALREEGFNRLAACVEEHLDMSALIHLLQLKELPA